MNLNREQFLRAVEQGRALLAELKKDYPELSLKSVFSRFGPLSGQCDMTTDLREIILDFSGMLVTSDVTKQLRHMLFVLKKAEKEKEDVLVSKLRKQCDELESKLLASELKLYCGDVLIEFRPGILKYESLRRLQKDSRLPPELNEVGSIRVVTGSLEKWMVGKVQTR